MSGRTVREQAEAAIRAIEGAKAELEQIDQRLDSYDNEEERGNLRLALDRLHRWRERTIRVITDNVNGMEAMRLRAITNPVVVTTSNLRGQYLAESTHYDEVLVSLLAALNEHPEDFFAEAPAQPKFTIAPPLPQALSAAPTTAPGTAPNEVRHRVFVVHGRNREARTAVVQFLRCLGLEVLDWERAVRLTRSSSPTTLEVVHAGMAAAQAILVLLTPDELATLHPALTDPGAQPDQGWQPRQNVIFEAGMALAIARERTILVRLGRTREMSDVAGINYVSLDNRPRSRQRLIDRLGAAGCAARVSEDCWDSSIAGDFDACLPDLNLSAEEAADAAAPSVSGEHPFYSVRYADVNHDGIDELLVQYPVGAHGSVLKIFQWDLQLMEMALLAELQSGSGRGFEVGDVDGDGKIEITNTEPDVEPGFPYAFAPPVQTVRQWNGHEFEVIGKHKFYTSRDVERIRRELEQWGR